MVRKSISPLVAFAACLAAPAAAETPGAGFSLGLTGVVPVICRASFEMSSVPVQPGRTPLGQLNEFCNNANGYQIYVDASPELGQAELTFDGQVVSLAGEGPTLVLSSRAPGIASRDVSLVANHAGGGSLSFTIVPL